MLVFTDSFEQYEHEDLPHLCFDPQAYRPKHPGVFTIEAKDDGTAEVIRQYNGETEKRVLAAGESAWGIEWTGTGHNVTDEAWKAE